MRAFLFAFIGLRYSLVSTFSTLAQYPSFVILGVLANGQVFRPSDWAERLCGVMSAYQPEGVVVSRLTYSPFVMPGQESGQRCVYVDGEIGLIEPMAYKFLKGFAADNGLQLRELPFKAAL
jgi:Protein of unknown function (DUF3579)